MLVAQVALCHLFELNDDDGKDIYTEKGMQTTRLEYSWRMNDKSSIRHGCIENSDLTRNNTTEDKVSPSLFVFIIA